MQTSQPTDLFHPSFKSILGEEKFNKLAIYGEQSNAIKTTRQQNQEKINQSSKAARPSLSDLIDNHFNPRNVHK